MHRKNFSLGFMFAVFCLGAAQTNFLRAEDVASQEEKPPTWLHPKITIYNAPRRAIPPEKMIRANPQIIQKLIDLLEERNFNNPTQSETGNPLLNQDQGKKDLISLLTPKGLELQLRYSDLKITLAEALGWQDLMNVRVISEQNLAERLTEIARWSSAPQTRAIGLISLGELHNKDSLVYFQEAFWSRDIGIRYAGIEALLKWNYPDLAIPLLRERMKKDDSVLIQLVAANALARLGQEEGYTMLRNSISHADWLVRALAAKALGEVGNHDDYNTLLTQINREQSNPSSNEFVLAEMAVAALRLFPKRLEFEHQRREAKKRAKQNLPEQEATAEPAPRSDILFELDPFVVKAPRLLIEQKVPADPRVNYQLLNLLTKNPNLGITDTMANNSPSYSDLNKLNTPSGIRLKQRYSRLGILLSEGLAGSDDFQINDALRRIADQGEDIVKMYALVTLAYTRDPSYSNLYQEALRSDNVGVRFAAIEALEIWGGQDAINILLSVTKLDRSPILRVYAAQAAWRWGELLGRDHLQTALRDNDWVARAMSIRFLGEMGSPKNEYAQLLAYFGALDRPVVEAELCSALLRLTAKYAEEQRAVQQQNTEPNNAQ